MLLECLQSAQRSSQCVDTYRLIETINRLNLIYKIVNLSPCSYLHWRSLSKRNMLKRRVVYTLISEDMSIDSRHDTLNCELSTRAIFNFRYISYYDRNFSRYVYILVTCAKERIKHSHIHNLLLLRHDSLSKWRSMTDPY